MCSTTNQDTDRVCLRYIEGKQGSQNLLRLPDDLFSKMPWLFSVHLGVHQKLEALPPLVGVPNLKSFTIAWLLSLRELPSLDHVPRLQRLISAISPQLEKVTEMASLENLKEFVITAQSRICCNGFLGACDVNDSICRTNLVSEGPTCLHEAPFLGSKETQSVFKLFEATICEPFPPDFNPADSIPTKEAIQMCDRRPFGRCELPGGIEGMCYNTRMQVLACLIDRTYIDLRRYQIERGIGTPCNPAREKWLGCGE